MMPPKSHGWLHEIGIYRIKPAHLASLFISAPWLTSLHCLSMKSSSRKDIWKYNGSPNYFFQWFYSWVASSCQPMPWKLALSVYSFKLATGWVQSSEFLCMPSAAMFSLRTARLVSMFSVTSVQGMWRWWKGNSTATKCVCKQLKPGPFFLLFGRGNKHVLEVV